MRLSRHSSIAFCLSFTRCSSSFSQLSVVLMVVLAKEEAQGLEKLAAQGGWGFSTASCTLSATRPKHPETRDHSGQSQESTST